jgi:hypothetical protein
MACLSQSAEATIKPVVRERGVWPLLLRQRARTGRAGYVPPQFLRTWSTRAARPRSLHTRWQTRGKLRLAPQDHLRAISPPRLRTSGTLPRIAPARRPVPRRERCRRPLPPSRRASARRSLARLTGAWLRVLRPRCVRRIRELTRYTHPAIQQTGRRDARRPRTGH